MTHTHNGLPGLVIFDCDGVLVDSEPVTTAILAEDLTAHGLPITIQEVDDLFVGGTIQGVFTEARRLGATLPDAWVTEIYTRMYARLRQGVPLIKGILSVLDRLDDRGIPYCVGSNGSPEKMSITLGHNGLLERFGGHLYSAHSLGTAKPDPGLYLHAAAQFGIAPAECVVVDDSKSGCTAGVRAGMKTYGFAETTEAGRLRDVGAEPVGSMVELAQKLGLTPM